MPGRKSKREPSSSSIPPSPCPSIADDDAIKDDGAVSEKRGRKESEQKRRVVMNQYFDELIALLTLLSQKHVPKKMDKVATLREAITCLKVYHDLTCFESPPQQSKLINRGDALSLLLNSQDAFLVMISDSGRIMFSSSLVTSLLGYVQSRLIGQNWYDFIHDQDKEVFHSLFSESSSKRGCRIPNSSVTAFPVQTCTLHLRLYPGETGGFPQYLPFKCLAYLRKWRGGEAIVDDDPLSPDETFGDHSLPLGDQHFMFLIGKLPTSLTSVDLPVSTKNVNFEFELRVSKEGRIISIDKHAILVIGYTNSEIIGTSFFDYVDPYHLSDVAESISSFSKTGLGTTTPYRLITKSGRYIWLISKTYTSYNPWVNKPDHILITSRVLGCDQVLPEHRFYRSRKLLPDLETELEYVPSVSSKSSDKDPSATPNLQQNPLVEKHMTTLQTHSQAPPLSQPLQTAKPHEQSSTIDFSSWIGFSNRPPASQSVTFPTPSNTSVFSEPFLSRGATQLPDSLLEIQKELERKNREIFEMQQRLLEQQKLFEAERSQFFQASQRGFNSMTSPSPHKQLSSTCQSTVPTPQSTLSNSLTDITAAGSPISGGRSNPPTPVTQHGGVFEPKPSTAAHFMSHSGPPTPQTAYSPFSPASNVGYSAIPSPSVPLNTPQLVSTASPAHAHPPLSLGSHLDMLMYNQPPAQQFPPNYLPYSSSLPLAYTTNQESASSLSMHNSLVCDNLGLSSTPQLDQSQVCQAATSPAISHIQTLSNLFGGT